MTDKKEKAIRLGAKAKALLGDEALTVAFASVEQLFIDRWKNSTDPTERDRCWMAINLTAQVRSALVTFVNNGKISQQDLDAIVAQGKAA
jgi:hypothetical protein